MVPPQYVLWVCIYIVFNIILVTDHNIFDLFPGCRDRGGMSHWHPGLKKQRWEKGNHCYLQKRYIYTTAHTWTCSWSLWKIYRSPHITLFSMTFLVLMMSLIAEHGKSLEDDVCGDTSGMFQRVLVSLLAVNKTPALSYLWRRLYNAFTHHLFCLPCKTSPSTVSGRGRCDPW